MENSVKYDLLKYELFEGLLPGLIYTGSKEEQLALIEELEVSGKNLMQDLFSKLCEQDDIPYPFDEEVFQVSRYEQGGIHFIEIEIPESDPQISHDLRAYILYISEHETKEKNHWRYFIVKRFGSQGYIHILYITPGEEPLLGDELTKHPENREYERRRMARTYLSVLMNESEQLGEGKGSGRKA